VLSAQDGYQRTPESQVEFFQANLDTLSEYIDAFEAMYSEPLIFDDALRIGLDEFVKQIVLACETLIVVDGTGRVAGICIYNVRKNSNFEIMGWVAPEYRKGMANQRFVLRVYRDEILRYAWERLQCVKISSSTHSENLAAIRFNKNVGLQMIGRSRKEMMIQGELFDAYLFECINPAIDSKPIKV